MNVEVNPALKDLLEQLLQREQLRHEAFTQQELAHLFAQMIESDDIAVHVERDNTPLCVTYLPWRRAQVLNGELNSLRQLIKQAYGYMCSFERRHAKKAARADQLERTWPNKGHDGHRAFHEVRQGEFITWLDTAKRLVPELENANRYPPETIPDLARLISPERACRNLAELVKDLIKQVDATEFVGNDHEFKMLDAWVKLRQFVEKPHWWLRA